MNIIQIDNPIGIHNGNEYYTETTKYRDEDGGVRLWFDELEEAKYTNVYLYKIQALLQQIGNGMDENGEMKYTWDMVYYIRWKGFKK